MRLDDRTAILWLSDMTTQLINSVRSVRTYQLKKTPNAGFQATDGSHFISTYYVECILLSRFFGFYVDFHRRVSNQYSLDF